MSLTRMLAAGALLAIGAAFVSVPACIVANDFDNGAECLRDEECASKQCTAGKCVSQNGDACQTDDRCPPSLPDGKGHCDNGHCRASSSVVDSGTAPVDSTPVDGTASDVATDAPADSGTDAPTDTGSATDTTPAADDGVDGG